MNKFQVFSTPEAPAAFTLLDMADPSRPYGGPSTISLFAYTLLHAPRLFGKGKPPRR